MIAQYIWNLFAAKQCELCATNTFINASLSTEGRAFPKFTETVNVILQNSKLIIGVYHEQAAVKIIDCANLYLQAVSHSHIQS